jgi:hypothetical protein
MAVLVSLGLATGEEVKDFNEGQWRRPIGRL